MLFSMRLFYLVLDSTLDCFASPFGRKMAKWRHQSGLLFFFSYHVGMIKVFSKTCKRIFFTMHYFFRENALDNSIQTWKLELKSCLAFCSVLTVTQSYGNIK